MATPPPPPEPGRRLGRGLDALLGTRKSTTTSASSTTEQTPASVAPESALRNIPLTQIRANPFQPRKEFRPEQLADLEASLKANGLLQPITVDQIATCSLRQVVFFRHDSASHRRSQRAMLKTSSGAIENAV